MSSYRPNTDGSGGIIRYAVLSILIHFIVIVVFLTLENPFKVTDERDRDKVINVKIVDKNQASKKAKDKAEPTDTARSIKDVTEEPSTVERSSIPGSNQETEVVKSDINPSVPNKKLADANLSKSAETQEKYRTVPDSVPEGQERQISINSPEPNYEGKVPDKLEMAQSNSQNSQFGRSTKEALKSSESRRFEIARGKAESTVRKLVKRPSFPYAKYSDIQTENELFIQYQLEVLPNGEVTGVEIMDDGDHPEIARRIIPWMREWVYKKSSSTDKITAVIHILE